MHERWRQRFFYVYCTHLVLFAELAGLGIYDLHVESRQGLAGRPRLLGERGESQEVGEDRATGFSLPVAIIDKFVLEVFLDPLESRHITSLAHKSNTLEMFQIVLIDILSLRVFLSDGSNGCRTGIQMID